jgi:hypothetical protein
VSYLDSGEGRERMRLRYLRDPNPVRLGNLASTLSRLSTEAAGTPSESAKRAIEESLLFLEWASADFAPAIQPQLAQMQRDLAQWARRWESEPHEDPLREELSRYARAQSDRVLEWSGLLDE